MAQSTSPLQVVPSPEDIRRLLRSKVLTAIHEVLDEELEAVLGSGRYERTQGRRGYRHGSERRRITTEVGPVELEVPRGRIVQPDGTTAEVQSTILPRYQRRTQRVNEALLGAYLAGANTRRIRRALEPLLGEANLSKSSISRVVQRVKSAFQSWSERRLEGERFALLYLDAIHLKVRMVRRVVSVPVLVALGVREDGQKELVALRIAASESRAAWEALIDDLSTRGMPAPVAVTSDGHAGLKRAIALWPAAQVQRCTVHKLENLLKHCPRHARAEVKRDYYRIIHAKDGAAAEEERQAFLRKWRPLCAEVARSLEEAGTQLLTFFAFPKEMHKSMRSSNAIENLNREFRRRTKTQGSFSTEEAAVSLLWGLVAFGQIKMRKIDGYEHLAAILAQVAEKERAA